ncbi:hypothetical protein D3C73_1121150 [compost metagenome]
MHGIDARHQLGEIADRGNRLDAVIYPRHDRNAHHRMGERGDAERVFENDAVVDTGIGPMHRRIDGLQVHQHVIDKWNDITNDLAGRAARRLHRRVPALLMAGHQKVFGKFVLEQRLTTRKRDPATGTTVMMRILAQFLHHLGNAHRLSGAFQCLCRTDFRTCSALDAFAAVDEIGILIGNRLGRTDRHALAAFDAG